MALRRRDDMPAATRRHREVVRRRDATFVPSIADALVLKDRDVFLVTGADGQVPRLRGHGLGLFMHDCRYLDRYEVHLGGRPLEILGADAAAGDSALLEATNPGSLGPPEAPGHVTARQLTVRWQRALDGASRTMHERFVVHSAGGQPATVTLGLEFDSDFEDIFEIRGLLHERVGQRHRPAWLGDALRIAYEGSDGFVRTLWVRTQPAPTRHAGGQLLFDLDLADPAGAQVLVGIALVEGSAMAPAPPQVATPRDPTDVVVERRPAAAHWLQHQTEVRSEAPEFDAVIDRSFDDLRMLVSTNGPESYFAAGVPWFVALFGRDSLIAALQALAFDPLIAADTLRILAAHQGQREDAWRAEQPGKILHELRVGEYAHLGLIPHTPYYGSVDATPLWLCLLGEHAAWTGDLTLFHELATQVEAALIWLERYGDADDDGYLEYDGQEGTGLVNQGWKDSADAIVDADGSLARAPIRLAEVQGYVHAARLAMADLFDRAGDPARASQQRAAAGALRRRFQRDFWLADEGLYAMALHGRGGSSGGAGVALRSVASNAGQVLWGRLATVTRARRTAATLMGPASFNGWGIRTLAATETAYDPLGYHLGTVWPHDNALIAAGFRRYGLDLAAERLFTGMFEAASAFPGRRLPELFAGFSRQDFPDPVPYPVACHPQAWAAGTMPYLLVSMLGLEPDAFAGRLTVRRPRLPAWLPAVELRGLRVGDGRADLHFRRERDGRVRVEAGPVEGLEVIEA